MDLTYIRQVISLGKPDDAFIVGSYNDPSLKYFSDIDFNQIWVGTPSSFVNALIKYIQLLPPNIFFSEFKTNKMKFNKLNDIVKRRNWIKKNLKGTIKLDLYIMYEGDRPMEITNNFFMGSLPPKSKYVKTFKEEMEELLSEGKYYKLLKRFRSLLKLMGKPMDNLTRFINNNFKLKRRIDKYNEEKFIKELDRRAKEYLRVRNFLK